MGQPSQSKGQGTYLAVAAPRKRSRPAAGILMNTSTSPMSTPHTPASTPNPGTAVAAASASWLGGQSIFERPDDRKIGRAMGASFAVHGLGLFLVLLALTAQPAMDAMAPDLVKQIVFLQEPGPGGGGGGSPAPAPPKPMKIPPHKAAAIPVTPVPVPTPPPPVPTLTAPIETTAADVLQATGVSSVSLASLSGGGRGGGLGSGAGIGVGPGNDAGFGGGAYMPGNGIINPTIIVQAEPKYTSEAMRAKIQGIVELEAVVLPNGTVGELRIIKSLDAQYGLDQEAIKAAKQWLFRPGTKQGAPVPVRVILELMFRLH
jgi:periplasmic protein TonB